MKLRVSLVLSLYGCGVLLYSASVKASCREDLRVNVENEIGQLRNNRSKRQSSATDKALPWKNIYNFSKKLAKIAGNNALLANINDMMTTNSGGQSKSYTYGYRGGYGGGYGGYYGGYPMMAQPVIYYVMPVQQVAVPVTVINGFTGDMGNSVSNTELLEQLIQLIQLAIDGSGDYTTGK